METSVVTVKGQIVIPSRLRKKAGIKQGTRVFLEERDGNIIVHPATAEFYERTCGILKGKDLLKTLYELRKQEKTHEEKKFERK